MNVEVRAARPGEAEALAAFADRLFRETYGPVCRSADVDAYAREHFTAEKAAAELRDPSSTVLVAEVDGRLAGYASLRRGEAPPEVEGDAPTEIGRFYVDAPWHGTGVAQALMRAALASMRERGGGVAWLPVWKENRRAIRFYEKLGFAVVGEQTFLMGSDLQEDHVMALRVAPRA